jgi:hypothetical protein
MGLGGSESDGVARGDVVEWRACEGRAQAGVRRDVCAVGARGTKRDFAVEAVESARGPVLPL